jgi:hypothetical protein
MTNQSFVTWNELKSDLFADLFFSLPLSEKKNFRSLCLQENFVMIVNEEEKINTFSSEKKYFFDICVLKNVKKTFQTLT